MRAIELKRLYFAQHTHGNGLATKLMQFNLELARKMQYQRVYLSVWEHNERAKAFYRKLGFADRALFEPVEKEESSVGLLPRSASLLPKSSLLVDPVEVRISRANAF